MGEPGLRQSNGCVNTFGNAEYVKKKKKENKLYEITSYYQHRQPCILPNQCKDLERTKSLKI